MKWDDSKQGNKKKDEICGQLYKGCARATGSIPTTPELGRDPTATASPQVQAQQLVQDPAIGKGVLVHVMGD